jgi:RNA polymerase sigma-70 factor, ECF subfamily
VSNGLVISNVAARSMIDHAADRVARIHAARLSGRFGFTEADRNDIHQELLMDYFIRSRRFNPAKSSRRTFLNRIFRHRVATLCESQSAACRDYRLRSDSLDGPASLGTGGSITLGDTISTDSCHAPIGRAALPSWDREELRIDIDRVIATLPSELAAIANMLRSEGVVETAYLLGVPRATLYRRIASIRVAFKSAGLDLYLRHSGASSRRRSRRVADPYLSGGSRRVVRAAR